MLRFENMNFDEFIQEIYRNDETILTYKDARTIQNMIDSNYEDIQSSNEEKLEEKISELEDDLYKSECENERLIGLLEDNNIKFQ